VRGRARLGVASGAGAGDVTVDGSRRTRWREWCAPGDSNHPTNGLRIRCSTVELGAQRQHKTRSIEPPASADVVVDAPVDSVTLYSPWAPASVGGRAAPTVETSSAVGSSPAEIPVNSVCLRWRRSFPKEGPGIPGEPEEACVIVTDESDPGDGEQRARTLDALVSERRKKRDVLADQGIDPYPARFDRTALAADLHERHGELPADVRSGETVRMAGRLTAIRAHGRLSFATLQDVSGSVQLLMQESVLSDPAKAVLASCDLGDWVGAEGEAITSRRGELSVDVQELWLLSKALRPPPDKWHGLAATDTRYRQREVDLLANPDSRRVFDIRFRTIAALRAQLVSEHFIEVDTPILQPQAGGALARPFLTHSNALDIDLSLRIAPELYLKRLVVGGYERVFELARNFRNEGIDTRHSPEFTLLEAYRAFGDATDGMDLTERLIVEAARSATGRLTFAIGDRAIDLSSPWPRRQLLDWLEELVGRRLHPTDPVEEVRAVCERHGVDYLPEWGSGKLIFELYDTILLPTVVNPVFICGFPVEVSPLARRTEGDPTLADRFELAIDAKEFANGYSELNIPEEQQERFRSQAEAVAQGDLEAQPADLAFVRALEYGLPPTSGIGIGVDRLVMLLAEVEAIRDVILFPMMRPEAGG
jgi:lysyl-tRNA synthetase class 2